MKIPHTSNTPLQTPVLFLVFNRPETTKLVFEEIRNARPSKLYVAADGPREHVEGEVAKCIEVKSIIDVDWDCQVRTLYRKENLGLGIALSNAINWFFENETEGIILEDDCLPSNSFFTFCSELLERYRDDSRVMQIGSNNFDKHEQENYEFSYRFSNLTYIWGWATWRRAWKLFDFRMNLYKEINKKGYLLGEYDSIYDRDYYSYVFSKMHEGDENISSRTIWSYQWQFACKINSGLIIVPSCNLIKNLGFGEYATNTHNPTAVGYDLEAETIAFPLKHPPYIMVDKVKEKEIFKLVCTSPKSRRRSKIKNILPDQFVEKVVKPILSYLT